MNYIKPEDIKEYVSKNPEGIAGMSEELAVMVNHFAELIVRESIMCAEREWVRNGDTEHNRAVSKVIGSIKQHFGVQE
jgi:hypothetical protein